MFIGFFAGVETALYTTARMSEFAAINPTWHMQHQQKILFLAKPCVEYETVFVKQRESAQHRQLLDPIVSITGVT